VGSLNKKFILITLVSLLFYFKWNIYILPISYIWNIFMLLIFTHCVQCIHDQTDNGKSTAGQCQGSSELCQYHTNILMDNSAHLIFIIML